VLDSVSYILYISSVAYGFYDLYIYIYGFSISGNGGWCRHYVIDRWQWQGMSHYLNFIYISFHYVILWVYTCV